MKDFETQVRELESEVDKEAARLVSLGVQSWDAVIQASQRIRKRRQEKVLTLDRTAP